MHWYWPISSLLLPLPAILFSQGRWPCRLQVSGFVIHCSPLGLASGKVGGRKKPRYFSPSLSALAVLWQQLHLPHRSSFCHLTPAPGLQEHCLLLVSLQGWSSFLLLLISEVPHCPLFGFHNLFDQFLVLTSLKKNCRVVSGLCFPLMTLTTYTIYAYTYR